MIITTHELYDFYYLITVIRNEITDKNNICLLYTSDAADD